MKKTKQLLALLLTAAMTVGAAATTATAVNNRRTVRVVVENNTLSTENGAPWSGTLFDTTVNVSESDTMLSVLETAFSENQCSQTGLENGYLTEVGGLSAEDGGSMGGWMITLDDWITDEGASAYTIESGKLEPGDTVKLVYSCSWGADIGYDWSGNDTSLRDVLISGGTLTSDFTSDVYDYIITLSEGEESLSVVPHTVNKAYRAKTYLNTYTPAEGGTDFKAGEAIPVKNGDVIIIGVANSAWMQSNYNQAEESIYRFSIAQETPLPDVKVQETESLINAIGDVTNQSGSAIKAARECYDSLSEEQQAKVSNYEVLEQAEKTFADLPSEQKSVSVEELRNAFGTTAPAAPLFGNEWTVISLSRMDLLTDEMKESYLRSVKEQLDALASNQFSATRSTVNSGVAAALTSMGVDASDFYGYDLLAPLTDVDYVTQQGINGAVYALIALNSHPYPMTATTEQALINALLDSQEPDGGWTIDTWSGVDDGSDADMTAMVLQSLAPYVQKNALVSEAVEKALTFLSDNQNAEGQFRSYGSYDCESAAQVLTALCELHIDFATDERFVKNGKTAYDGLLSFCLEDLTFSHFKDDASNALSTTQATIAVAALYRVQHHKTTLFDMSDVSLSVNGQDVPAEQPSRTGQPDPEKPVQDSLPTPTIPNTVKTGDAGGVAAGSLCCLLLSALVLAAVAVRKNRQH